MKKIDSFIKLNNKEFYKKVFGESVISVSGIYPNSFSYDRKIYDNAKENYDFKIVRDIPVSLYNPDNNGYFIGLLRVEVYA